MHGMSAARAYKASTLHRSQREQDADVFRRATAALRAAGEDGMAQVRALADNRKLWTMVIDLVRDPANPLPVPLRAHIVSVGLAVNREMDSPEPDFPFLIGVNEQLAAGLAGGGR